MAWDATEHRSEVVRGLRQNLARAEQIGDANVAREIRADLARYGVTDPEAAVPAEPETATPDTVQRKRAVPRRRSVANSGKP